MRPVTLLSAPGAAVWAGAGWWRALVDQATTGRREPSVYDILDCADAPGRAMAAIRAGQRRLVLSPACPAFARIATLAMVLPERPPALDLAEHGATRRLDAWLATGGALSSPPDDSAGIIG